MKLYSLFAFMSVSLICSSPPAVFDVVVNLNDQEFAFARNLNNNEFTFCTIATQIATNGGNHAEEEDCPISPIPTPSPTPMGEE